MPTKASTTGAASGPLTVFAPTDEAFAKLPKGTVESLLKAENRAELEAILTYHVVPGEFAAADVLASTELSTVNGASAPISLDTDGNPRIDDAIIDLLAQRRQVSMDSR